jgi:hypothetical protein
MKRTMRSGTQCGSVLPLVLGTGHRLFAHGFAPTSLELINATPTTTGVVVATYRKPR